MHIENGWKKNFVENNEKKRDELFAMMYGKNVHFVCLLSVITLI